MGIKRIWSSLFGGEGPKASAKPAKPAEPVKLAGPVQQVYLFISSTFNDMHAERDYLVKYVFPELKDWCFSQGLELVDIDLRWGITDREAARGQTVDTCLNVIGSNAPMLLVNLTGERTGWIPQPDQVSAALRESYPVMDAHFGDKSITELEVLFYELVSVLDGALFLFREPVGPCDWNEDQKRCYTNYGEPGQEDLNRKLQAFRKAMLKDRRAHRYRCRWDASLRSPELLDAEAGGVKLPQAAQGRFTDFTAQDGASLKDFILSYFQRVITAQITPHLRDNVYTGHSEAHIQQRFLLQQGVSYLPFPGSFARLEEALAGEKRFLVLYGAAGAGKSAYLAHFILTHREEYDIHYRFLGVSRETEHEISVLGGLVQELWDSIFAKARAQSGPLRPMLEWRRFPDVLTYLYEDQISLGHELAREFPALMNQMEAGLDRPVLIVLDGLDQLDYDFMDWTWANTLLYFARSCQVRFLISCKSGTPHEAMLRRLAPPERAAWLDAWTPAGEEERRTLIHYLTARHLKHLTEEQEDKLLRAPQGGNFLFLKSAVEEICTWGIRTRLDRYLDRLAGEDLQDTFQTILARAEGDQPYCRIPPQTAIPAVLGLLAYARYGLSASCLRRAMGELLPRTMDYTAHPDGTPVGEEDLTEAINYCTYQLRHFLIFSQGRVDILYDSFRRACQTRFAAYAQGYHRALALAYSRDMDTRQLEDRETAEAYLEHSYHLAAAGEWGQIAALLRDLGWLRRKARLGQLYQVQELSRALPPEDQDEAVSRWLRDHEGVLTREPQAVASLYLNDFPDRNWTLSPGTGPWVGYDWDRPAVRQGLDTVQAVAWYGKDTPFPQVRIHNGVIYLAHGGDCRGIAAFNARTLRPLCQVSGMLGALERLFPQEDALIQRKGSQAVLYRVLPKGQGTVQVLLDDIPQDRKIVELWYESGSLFLWTAAPNHADICLCVAELPLESGGTVSFEDLDWQTLYERELPQSYQTISASAAYGAGVLSLEGKEIGRTLVYTCRPFRVIAEYPCSIWDWQVRGTNLLLLHTERCKKTWLLDRAGVQLAEADTYLDVTPADRSGTVYLHISGLCGPQKPGSGGPMTAAGGDTLPPHPEGGTALTVSAGGAAVTHLLAPGYLYRFSLKRPKDPPLPVAYYEGSTMFLERWENCLLTQELDELHVIPVSGDGGRPFRLPVPQAFLGSGFGAVPGQLGAAWQVEGNDIVTLSGESGLMGSGQLFLRRTSLLQPRRKPAEQAPLWKCQGSGWLCRLDREGRLTFRRTGREETVETTWTAPKSRLFPHGLLVFWQGKQAALVDTTALAGEAITVQHFSRDVVLMAANEYRTWFILDPVKDGYEKRYMIVCLENGELSSFEVALPEKSQVLQALCHRETCILLYREEVDNLVRGPKDVRVGMVRGPKRQVTRLMTTDGEDVLSYNNELPYSGRVLLDADGTLLLPSSAGAWRGYALTGEGLEEKTGLPYHGVPGYPAVLGLHEGWAVLKSESCALACVYDYERDKLLCSFPLPEEMSVAERIGDTLYLSWKDGRGIVTAQLHNLEDDAGG